MENYCFNNEKIESQSSDYSIDKTEDDQNKLDGSNIDYEFWITEGPVMGNYKIISKLKNEIEFNDGENIIAGPFNDYETASILLNYLKDSEIY